MLNLINMTREKLTIKSLRHHLRDNLSPYYPEGEMNAIIRILLSFMSGKDNVYILSHPDHEISSYNWFKVNKICDYLKKMMPVQYITGSAEFYGRLYKVTPDTLIPRQETEELVDLVIRENSKIAPLILETGTGTGCVAVSLALHIDGAAVTATDISKEIITVAEYNAIKNSAEINFIIDDMLSPDISKYGEYDLAVCNPPYISESEKLNMEKNVLDYEPHQALFVPDMDPLLYYRSVLELCKTVLKPGASLYFEINETKAREMKNILYNYGYRNISIINDINGKARISKGIKG
ncbi:MAG: peptide chain release factor N(5)-glutamine methyltransferase [Bacteroidales bacterium]|nr:peptide chain release factor N(5)-glutamine methyltransferase [Bacteroidales bacterium]